MSKMLSKMNLISVVQQLPKEDIETIQGYVEMIEEQNRELKKKYLNAVADYETTMAEKNELKKQLEENKDNYNCLLKQKEQFEYIMSKQVDYQGQQKEFIKYLEKRYKDITNVIGSYGSNTDMLYGKKNMIEEILQKYKSIMGENDV